jgi:hypothetical protein
VATKDAGFTAKGVPYQMKFTDEWGNVNIKEVEQPDKISMFFEHSNTIDKHNQCRQAELALENHWQKNAFFHILSHNYQSPDTR